MAVFNWLLFFHLLGAFTFFAGTAVAATLQLAAIRAERPSETLMLLRLAGVGVVFVGIGSLLTLFFGIALTQHLDFGFSPVWIQASLALWVVAMAIGGIGGRTARRARDLAERLASSGDQPSAELRSLVAHRPSLWAGYLSTVLIVVVVVLMVWRPG